MNDTEKLHALRLGRIMLDAANRFLYSMVAAWTPHTLKDMSDATRAYDDLIIHERRTGTGVVHELIPFGVLAASIGRLLVGDDWIANIERLIDAVSACDSSLHKRGQ